MPFCHADALLAIGFTRDDRLDSLFSEEAAKRIGETKTDAIVSVSLSYRLPTS
jgi:hypothetical protein